MSQPISVTTRPISKEDRIMLKEQQDIALGVADVTFAWANLENYMVMVLAQIILDKTTFLASAIYFTPASIDNRVKIVENALKAIVADTPAEAPLLGKWHSLANRLIRQRKTRNKVAHSHITIISGTPSYARLTTPMLKRDPDEDAAMRKGQKPGMGSNELRNSAKATHSVGKEIVRFVSYVKLVQAADYATLLQKLSEAEVAIQTTHHPDNPTPPTPKSPPSPSPQ